MQAFNVSRETARRLELYADLLSHWQKTINLVAPSTLPDLWQRHFGDSAQLLKLVPADARTLLDLGSGAGFPGLVLAILMSEKRGAKVWLLESDMRKAAFLREVARQTGVAVDILCARIESPATHTKVGTVDVVTARALAPLGRLVDLAAPYFGRHSKGLFLKGRDVEAEIAEARQSWEFDCTLNPSISGPEGQLAVISNLRVKSEG